MAGKSFTKTNGSAIKNTYYKYKDGTQSIRIFGGILPRYVYWKKNADNKNISVECLAFNRETEKFDNVEEDHFKEAFPDQNCGWAYICQAITEDANGSKVVSPVSLKKKMFEQIQQLAEDLGDPTDPETGWDIVFERKKTGPQAFNVEYTIKQLRCKPRPLDEEEKQLIADARSLEDIAPRPTADEVKELLAKQFGVGVVAEDEDGIDKDATGELSQDFDDDIPM